MSIGLADAQEVCFVPLAGPNFENSLFEGQIQVKSEDSESVKILLLDLKAK
jgi:LPS-assembly protein